MQIDLTEPELLKLLEVQYLKGRLDELQLKAYPNIVNLQRQRKIDMRIDKYYKKLKQVDESAYYLYMTEHANRIVAKRKSQAKIKELLEDILPSIDAETQKETYEKIKAQLHSYKWQKG